MAKHKAPTQITIASIQEETFFHQFVARYWKLGVLVACAVALGILIPTYTRREALTEHRAAWDELRGQGSLGSGFSLSVTGGSPESLALFADQHKGSAVGGWAKAIEVGEKVKGKKLDEAAKTAAQITQLWPGHVLSRTPFYAGADGSPQTLEQAILAGKGALQAWEKEHAILFSNPPLPADAPKVRLNTSKGAITLGLYSDRAPKHTENFLKLCREGFYNGTKFHRVVRGSLVQGGDPNSVAGEPESWGLGGPSGAIEEDIDARLRHFKGAVAAWRGPGEKSSHGSQFQLITADQNQLDGQTAVFGIVLDGQPAIEAIESGAVVGDRPQDPVVIESTEVL